MKNPLRAIVFLLLLVRVGGLLAQSGPTISYAGPQNYTVGSAIAPLIPVNTGGGLNIYPDYGEFNLGGGARTFTTINGLITGLTIDASGNLYAANRDHNLINKISPAGVVTTFAGSGAAGSANGTGAAASFNSPTGVTVDASGNVYVADAGNNLIREINPAGVVTTFAGNGTVGSANGTGALASFNNPQGVTIDGTGTVFVADAGNNLIRKITPAGMVTIFAGSGAAGAADGMDIAASFNVPTGITVDASGNVYVADRGNGLIREISPTGLVTTLAGLAGGLNDPTGVAVDVSGNVYVTDFNDGVVIKVSSNTFPQITTYAGLGTAGGIAVDAAGNVYNGESGNVQIVVPALPAGLGFDSSGTISGTPTAISPTTTYTIEADNAFGGSTTTLSITVNNLPPVFSYPQSPLTVTRGIAISVSPIYTGGAPASYVLNTPLPAGLHLDGITGVISGTASAASAPANYSITAFNIAGSGTTMLNITVKNPVPAPNISYASPKTYTTGMAIAPLIPANMGGIVPATTLVGTFAGTGAYGAVNGQAMAASFANPVAVTIDVLSNVYVSDAGNNLIRKISPAGLATTFAGGFNGPSGVTVDESANVYVADAGNNLIDEISPEGVVTYFSNGKGPIPCAQCPNGFGNPTSIVFAGGSIYTADNGNYQVDNVTSGGVQILQDFANIGHTPWGIATSGNAVYTDDAQQNSIFLVNGPLGGGILAGSAYVTGSANGTGAAASFNTPRGLATDAQGNIYVADAGNNLIRKITPAGVVTTFAGSGAQGSTNGADTLASFNRPYGLIVDPFGNVYVADAGNNLIRKIVPGGYTISPALPAGLVFDNNTGKISGTPTATSPATDYTVTAYNGGGIGTTIVNIAVVPGTVGLASLHLSSGTLSPAFATATTDYTANVSNSISSIMLTPKLVDLTDSITVNGTIVASGSASAGLPLVVGPNVVTVKVFKLSAATTYTVTVTRGPSEYAFLANLELSSGTISPTFTATVLNYTSRASRTTSSITITPITLFDFETVTINGIPVTPGTASSPILLNVGTNNISIVVTAQNGRSTKTYTLQVTKESGAFPGSFDSFYQTTSVNDDIGAIQFTIDHLNVHQALSPNGDGINDALVINDIASYPENRLLIMNRLGDLIYEAQGYDNTSKVFNGRSNNGKLQNPGTYFY
ncbi:MAG TPA: cadherin-like beta sandwich domain-containing protein, partial [Mucilaginibacter sp.]